MPFDPQANRLNETIERQNPFVANLLSLKGRTIFFPKLGILSQAADADACAINATIGMALEEDCSPMCLPSIAHNVLLPPKDVFYYAKNAGHPELRQTWLDMMLRKNPALVGMSISKPVVTSALTHGLSLIGSLLCDANDTVIVPQPFWENYDLIFGTMCGAEVKTFPAFTATAEFNLAGLRKAFSGAPGKRIVLLNFPNNPTGYTPSNADMNAIVAELVAAAEAGNDVAVIVDDAYFGLVYEDGVPKESIFSKLADAHVRILAIKLDGPTKEDYVWGFRVGFCTFGVRGGTRELYDALESKMAGLIRATVSNVSMISQSLLLAAYRHPNYEAEKQLKYNTLRSRYEAVRKTIADHPEYSEVFTALPFNSGYFMCVRLAEGIDGEKLRRLLITEYGTGLITFGRLVRVAFASTPCELLPVLFANMYSAGKKIASAA